MSCLNTVLHELLNLNRFRQAVPVPYAQEPTELRLVRFRWIKLHSSFGNRPSIAAISAKASLTNGYGSF